MTEIKNKTTELNPCPFCRNSVEVKQRGYNIFSYYSIYCPVCKCEAPMFFKKEDAISDWNSRTTKTVKQSQQ